ncbi:Rrf2 family transcriptional regulator [Lacihabitans sp. CCS-44]|uniref:Rrf2 family transcriptional regulator n=1 Tax=Lacihabitans sp. CCS-44 TaxID=2487331 RepID=UPI0020CDC251|nr:Rrf2 family transcriptional regulator [Lacihabitans sp. CCS-44]MCP9753799.1 Rrf2 family transcriptional regulator [Lacihabitans sp. CCS-44]
MEFTKKTIYTIKALVFLHKKEKLISVSEIVKCTQIPKKFLENIMLELKKKGFVESFQGKLGGYKLLKRLEDIAILEILDFTECKVQLTPRCGDRCDCISKVECRFKALNHVLLSNYLKTLQNLKVLDFT